MQCSPEKLAANQANSKKSGGPKTEAGKLASRRNAIKHGLTGEGLALPDEDAAQVEAAFERHFREMNPRTEVGATLVYKVALCRVRIQRFAQAEAATLSQRVLDAGFAFDDAQVARRDECRAKLHQDPAAQLAILSRFRAGVDWVLDAWEALACALTSAKLKNWRQPQYDLFEALTGHSPEFPSYFDSTFWNLAARGDEGALDNPDLPGNSPAARWQSARERMLAICEEEIARWEALVEPATAATALARANAIQSARYDGSKEGLLAKKYEAATTRELNKALKDFKEVEAEFAEEVAVVETPEPEDPCVELGSFLPEIEVDPGELAIVADGDARTPQIRDEDRLGSAPTSLLEVEVGQNGHP